MTDLHLNYPFFLSDFNETWMFSINFRKIFKYQISWNLVQLGAKFFYADGRTDGLRDGYDEAVHNFMNAPEISSRYWHLKLSCTLHDSKNCIKFYLISIQKTADSWYKWSWCQACLMSSCILLLYKMSPVILSHLQFHAAKWKTDECFRGKYLI